MKYWAIQKRILLITLLPCLFIAIAMGSYYTLVRLQGLGDQFTTEAQAISRQVAMNASQWFAYDHARLENQLQLYLDMEQVTGIGILTPEQVSIFYLGPSIERSDNLQVQMIQELHQFDGAEYLRIRAPVFYQHGTEQGKLRGWVALEFDRSIILIQKYQSVITALVLVLITTLLGLYLSLRASQRISQPLQAIAVALEQLESGNLDSRIRLDTDSDFSMLATGINTMAASLQHAQQALQDSVEQATQDLKETLETLEVQNIELNLARKEALDASQTKSEFLANMSHEIRTPLNGILGFAKLLRKTSLNRRQSEYLQTIESSSSSLLVIINDILDFSKIEAGKLVLDSVPVLLRDIMDEVLTMLAPEAHRKGLELASLVYNDVPQEVVGDPGRLKQIITNLVSNAVKFTEQGSVIIRVMVEEQAGEKTTLRFTISDTGIGLSELQQENLFQSFTQADQSTSRRFGGTGLGLVISKYLVDHMQGDIGVESELGKGSTFWFTAQFDEAESQAEQQNTGLGTDNSAFVLCTKTATGQAIQNQLKELSFDVTMFDSLSGILQKLDNLAPSVCLIEVNEIQRNPNEIQQIASLSPVIALLPSNDTTLSDYCRQIDLKQFLVYPVAQRQLFQSLCDVLGVTPISNLEEGDSIYYDNKPVKVLAVDDNEPNLKLLTTWLQDLDVEVTRARGGKQAVAMATSHKFHLIFMDIQMPDMDGVTAGKIIKNGNVNPDTPLVALTAHALPNERKQLLQDGFDDYLTKPLSEEHLSHTLQKWTHFHNANHRALGVNNVINHDNIQPIPKANNIVDIDACLTLAGGKHDLAKDMLQGLIDEIEQIKPLLIAQSPDQMMEPVHKLNGLCRYVGVPKLKAAVEAAETCLKTDTSQWYKYKSALTQAINDVEIHISNHDCFSELDKVS